MRYALPILGTILLGSLTASAQIGFTTATIEDSTHNKVLVNADKNGSLKGLITTHDGEPAAFVNVILKGTAKGALTGEDGTFSINNIKPGSYTVIISHAGLQTVEEQITITDGHTLAINVALNETSKQLDEVIIQGRKSLNTKPATIGKVAIAPMDLPQSITIIGENLIRDQQMQRLSDVIKNVNGVYLSTTRGSTQESFAARGYTLGAANLFKNGARVNSGAMPEMSSLEKVEVLKGSSAILFGQVSPGGVVNMVTKKPKFEQGGEISMRVGSYDLYKPSFDIYGPATSNIAYRLNGTYEKANSYRDVVHSERFYVNPSLLFKLSPKTELLVQGDYLQHEFTPDFGVGSFNNKPTDVARSSFFGTNWQYAKTKQTTGTANLKHELNKSWTINGILSYQKYSRDYFSTERINNIALADIPGKGIKTGDWVRPVNKLLNEEDYYLAQIDITGKFKTGTVEHMLLTGIDADRTITNNSTFEFTDGTKAASYDTLNVFGANTHRIRTDMPATAALRKGTQPMNRIGAYIQDLISVSDKIKVLAGVRYSYVEMQSPDTLVYKTGATITGKGKYDAAFSPRLGVVYKPTITTSIFTSYSNSFSVNSGTDIYNKALKPSVIDQFEIGVKNDFLKGALSVNVTGYKIINNNFAQMAPFTAEGSENANSSIKQLSGQTTSNGVEVDVTAHPFKGLDIISGYSYNDMRYTKTSNLPGSYFEGDRLVNTPAHTANGSVFYTFNEGAVKGLKIGASAFFTGKRIAGWNDQKVAVTNPPTPQPASRMMPMDAYTTIDFSAGYTFKKVSLLAKLSNITNELNYIVHENYSVNPIAPRQFSTTVSYRF